MTTQSLPLSFIFDNYPENDKDYEKIIENFPFCLACLTSLQLIPLEYMVESEFGRIHLGKLNINSEIHPAKMRVSRKQVSIQALKTGVLINNVGLNVITVFLRTRIGDPLSISLKSNQTALLAPGDSFSLAGRNFFFTVYPTSKPPTFQMACCQQNIIKELVQQLEGVVTHEQIYKSNRIHNMKYRPEFTRRGKMAKQEQEICPIRKLTQLSTRKTAVLYHPLCEKHLVPVWHTETPERILVIREMVDEFKLIYPDSIDIFEDFGPPSNEILLSVHTQQYLNHLQNPIFQKEIPVHISLQQVGTEIKGDDKDTYMSRFSLEAAKLAAGSVLKAIDLVLDHSYRSAFCTVRPPGHHCGSRGNTDKVETQGYCILNSVAIGAFYAKNYKGIKKISIVDLDVHHGNGTEQILSDQPEFQYISIHNGTIYPYTGDNQQKRSSNVVNVGIANQSNGQVWLKAFQTIIIPALEEFQPELLILSSGFDAHQNDPVEGLLVQEDDYFFATEMLKTVAARFCKERIVSVLEGGYNIDALKLCTREHLISLVTTTRLNLSQNPNRMNLHKDTNHYENIEIILCPGCNLYDQKSNLDLCLTCARTRTNNV